MSKLTTAERFLISTARKRCIAEHDTITAAAIGVLIAIDNDYTVYEIKDRITSLLADVDYQHGMKTIQVEQYPNFALPHDARD